MEIKEELFEFENSVKSEIVLCKNLKELEEKKIYYLSKNGKISNFLNILKTTPVEQKAAIGELINKTKKAVIDAFTEKENQLREIELAEKQISEAIDITIPGKKMKPGNKHIVHIINDFVIDALIPLGFSVEEGVEIENDVYNFQMLNIPENHPARDMQDTFYINENLLLRTHTSAAQVRAMLKAKGEPIKIICPGKAYRKDDDDATHSHQFNQIEGLVIDKDITMSDLKGTLEYLLRKLFGEKRIIRLRSSFFGFTEPSIEVDISCFNCEGKGCPICKGSGYIEVLGAGMVHPNVLKMAGYDPEIYQGFAFGIGADRIAMLKYNINDIRELFLNDLRVLNQFKKERN